MPLSKYFAGKGSSVMKKMKSEYGAEKGERIFYATANKMKTKGECKTCMGRRVEYHSPAKHPEQDDPYAAMDALTEAAAKRQPGTYRQQRQEMKPMQRESPKAAQGLMDYIKRLGGK